MKDLASRAGHEGEGVVEPVTLAQHHVAVLSDLLGKARKGRHAEQRDSDGEATTEEVDPVIIEGEPVEGDPNEREGRNRSEGADGDDPTQGLRRPRLVDHCNDNDVCKVS